MNSFYLLLIFIAGLFHATANRAFGVPAETINSKHHLSSLQSPLVPSPIMVDETKWLLNALEKAHYKKLSIDDLDKKLFLENYLKNLDKQKLFFTRPELEVFTSRYEPTLLTYLKQGNLFPAFEIYDSYRKNALSRLTHSINLLSQNSYLDNNESYLLFM